MTGGSPGLASGLHYRGTATIRDLDPARAWSGLPAGKIQLAPQLDGVDSDGHVTLQELDARVGAAQARMHTASLDFHGMGTLEVTASSRNLAELAAAIPGPPLGGRITLHATIERSERHLAIASTFSGRDLRSGPTTIGQLDGAVRARATAVAEMAGAWDVAVDQLRVATSRGTFAMAQPDARATVGADAASVPSGRSWSALSTASPSMRAAFALPIASAPTSI